MKSLVNGNEVDLGALPEVEVRAGEGVLYVRTEDGVRTALAVRHRGRVLVSFLGRTFEVEPAGRKRAAAAHGSGELRANMPGVIVDVLVQDGQEVAEGQRLLVVEAMKTQQPLLCPFPGLIQTVAVQPGDQVSEGDLLALVKRADPAEIQSE